MTYGYKYFMALEKAEQSRIDQAIAWIGIGALALGFTLGIFI